MRKAGVIPALVAGVFALIAVSPGAAQDPTLDQYLSTRLGDYAAIQASIAGMKQPPLRYGIHHLFLNGNWFPGMQNLTVLNQMTDLIHDTGASYLAVNVGPGPWLSNNSSQMSMFAQAVSYAQSLGLTLELYPTFPRDQATILACEAVNGHPFYTVNDWTRCLTTSHPWLNNLSVLQYWTVTYAPVRIAPVHEPTTMSLWLGISSSTSAWKNFLTSAISNIRQVSKSVLIGATCWKNESTYMQTFAQVHGLNWMGLDVYSDESSAMSTYLQMIGYAKKAHVTDIIMEEAGIEPWVPAGTFPYDGNAYLGVGNCIWQGAGGVHTPGFQALAAWASANGMTAISPFWESFTGAVCIDDSQIDNGLDIGTAAPYSMTVSTSLTYRTQDFYDFQAYVGAH